ncbi:hypothetical protein QAD02_021463 [Eretmocerus hayati]|uniref:Uncharacterized protein n=1 Tax=Eretmocerus hayati TaxID=131215 RepID=A0ACC2PQI2_9HYME|nr:hypothetical protein QAD02_021463 [Eretmocerus hayati]
MSTKKLAYKYCFVPGCSSTTSQNPHKNFLCVPRDEEKRKLWCQAVGRQIESTRGTVYCCEDHFDLKEDLRSYHIFNLVGGKKFLKEGVVPRYNLNKSLNQFTSFEGTFNDSLSLNQLRLVDDYSYHTSPHFKKIRLDSDDFPDDIDQSIYHPGIDYLHIHSEENGLSFPSDTQDASNVVIGAEELTDGIHPTNYSFDTGLAKLDLNENNQFCSANTKCQDNSNDLGASEVVAHKVSANEYFIEPDLTGLYTEDSGLFDSTNIQNDSDAEEISFVVEDTETTLVKDSELCKPKLMVDACVATEDSCEKSREVLRKPKTVDVEIQVKLRDMHISDASVDEDIFNTSGDTIESLPTDTSFSQPSHNTTTTSNSSERERQIKLLQEKIYENVTRKLIEHDPLLFLGVPKDSMYISKIIAEKTNLSLKNIYLTLKKIRQNHTNATLAYDFGYSERHIGRIFTSTVKVLVQALRKLVVWPVKEIIQRNLPISFRNKFRKVQSIIDCFEIQIEKPSNSIHQAASWSDYKQCNSAKYGISCTASCLINFISEGYGGRTSDTHLIENSGYLDKLPAHCEILADRGFKRLSTLVQLRRCKLVCPASVKGDEKSSEEDVRLSRQISSCRIHIERVIERIREFRFLDIHSTVDNHYLPILDDIVVIVCGIINIQGRVLKQ